jgi:hypothetical protein
MANRNEYQKLLLTVAGARPIAFNPALAHALGSAKAGLFLSQLLFWCDKGYKDQWIYKTIEEMQKETALSKKEQNTAIKICKKYSLIETKLMGIPAKRHFHLSKDNIIEFLKNYYASLPEKGNVVCTNKGKGKVPKGQTITENTT